MASPFVAGLAAKYWQADSKNDPAIDTRDLLHSEEFVTDIEKNGDDNSSGFGLLHVETQVLPRVLTDVLVKSADNNQPSAGNGLTANNP